MLMYCIDCGYKEDRIHFLRDEESTERICPSCKGINCFSENEISWCQNCSDFPVARDGLWCKKCISQDNDPDRFITS